MKNKFIVLSLFIVLSACQPQSEQSESTQAPQPAEKEVAYQQDLIAEDIKKPVKKSTGDQLLANYASFTLTADLSHLSENQKKMLSYLIKAAKVMDDLFWLQSYGDKDDLLRSIEAPALRRYAEINYGPWDRLNGDAPFIDGYGQKPPGARFYPPEMTKEQFDEQATDALKDLYTLVRTDEDGRLQAIPYHVAYQDRVSKAADYLRKAAKLAEDD